MTTAPTTRAAPSTGRADAPSSTAVVAPLQVRVYAHITEIAPAEWDALVAPDDLQATHRFVRACEEADIERAVYRHVVVRRGQHVEAIATFSAFRVGLDVLATGLARRALAALRRVRPGALRVPVVFCGLPVSFGRSCLRWSRAARGDEALRSEVLAAITDVAERLAEETRAPVICFKEFDADESAALAPLLARGYFRAPSLPGCRLTIPWRSPEAYAVAMRAPYRRQLLAVRRARESRGLEVHTQRDWSGAAARIHALYAQVIERAEFRLERIPPAFFDRLATLVPEARAVLVEHDGALVAAAIVLDGPSECTFLLAGIEYAVSRELWAYHALVDAVVAHAIETGARALELGQTSYDRKTRMGALPTSRDLYVRCRSPVGHRVLTLARAMLFPVVTVRPRRVFRRTTTR